VNPQGKPAFISEFSPLEFSLEGVKNTYGGGKYKYMAKASGGFVRQGTFEIEGEPTGGRSQTKPIYKRYINGKLVYSKPEDAEVILNSPQATSANGDITSLLLLELRGLRESLSRPIESPESIKKGFLEEMMIFKQLFGDDKKSPTEDFSKMALDLIKQGIEVGAMAENGGSPWLTVLEKVLPTVQDAIRAFSIQQHRGINRQQAHNPDEAIALSQVPITPEMPLTGFDSIADKLRAYLPTFISAASSNSDPNILVELTAPNIPEKDRVNVIEWLSSDKWFSDLCTLHPIIAGQRAWWGEYSSALLAMLTNPKDESEHNETE
jgi:hypothetical protein